MRKTYKGWLTHLPEKDVFVFGSNTEGIHMSGNAKAALDYFGAVFGQAEGMQGQSYAIVTKDLKSVLKKSISKEDIVKNIRKLYYEAQNNPDRNYYVGYSATGFLRCGYTNQEMADMFVAAGHPPLNVIFEEGFCKLLNLNCAE